MKTGTVYLNLKEMNEVEYESSQVFNTMKRRLRKANKKLRVSNLIIFILLIIFVSSITVGVNMIKGQNEKFEDLSDQYEILKKDKIYNNSVTLPIEKISNVDNNSDVIIESDHAQGIMFVNKNLPEKFYSVPLDDDLKNYIYKSAIDADIPAEIMFSIAWRESKFNPDAKSGTNDHGLFQINECNFSRLAKEFGYTYDEMCKKIYDPYINTDCSIYILKEYRDNYNNDNWHHVLMRYNMGPGKANSLFKSGIYSSEYSRAIISYAQNNFNITDITVN